MAKDQAKKNNDDTSDTRTDGAENPLLDALNRIDRLEAALTKLISDAGALSADPGHLQACRDLLTA